MAIEITRNCGLVKVLAAQASKKSVSPENAAEAAQIIAELASNPTPENRHMIAQVIGFTLQELQQKELDWLSQIADIKNIGYGDKAQFSTRLHGIKAFIQAKGSTTARSYISEKKLTLETDEISARPAMNIIDLRAGNIPFADLIAEANREITLKKLVKIERALQAAISTMSSPFYATGSGIVEATLDAQIAYFRRLGPVTLMGDYAIVSKLSQLTGMQVATGTTAFSDDIINEHKDYGYVGSYKGSSVVVMPNGYEDGSTTPVLNPAWLYIIPGGMNGEARNLKVVNEGGMNSIESQNIDDMTYEVRLDQWFGAGFVTGATPTIGAYQDSTL